MSRNFTNDANKENFNKFDYIKQLCVEHIYNSIEISRFKYELLEFKSGLPQLKQKKIFCFRKLFRF